MSDMQYITDDPYFIEQNRLMRVYEFFRGGRDEKDWKIKKSKLRDPEGFERRYHKFKSYHRKRILQLEQQWKDILKKENIRRFHGDKTEDGTMYVMFYQNYSVRRSSVNIPLDKDGEYLEGTWYDPNRDQSFRDSCDGHIGEYRQDLIDLHQKMNNSINKYRRVMGMYREVFERILTNKLYEKTKHPDGYSYYSASTVMLNGRQYIINDAQNRSGDIIDPEHIYNMNREKHFKAWR